MTNKYAHLTLEQLQEALATAEGYVLEQEEKIREYAKGMARKKATLSDISHANHMISFHFETKAKYEGWVADYTEAIVRAERVAEGHGQIVEYLEHMLQEDVKWHEKLVADYDEKGSEHYRQLMKEEKITKTVYEFARTSKEEAYEIFKGDLNKRYKKLVATVEKKVGKVQQIKVSRNWNEGFDGVVYGENGSCVLQTVLAGGYNIQRLHYRTLCK